MDGLDGGNHIQLGQAVEVIGVDALDVLDAVAQAGQAVAALEVA